MDWSCSSRAGLSAVTPFLSEVWDDAGYDAGYLVRPAVFLTAELFAQVSSYQPPKTHLL